MGNQLPCDQSNAELPSKTASNLACDQAKTGNRAWARLELVNPSCALRHGDFSPQGSVHGSVIRLRKVAKLGKTERKQDKRLPCGKSQVFLVLEKGSNAMLVWLLSHTKSSHRMEANQNGFANPRSNPRSVFWPQKNKPELKKAS